MYHGPGQGDEGFTGAQMFFSYQAETPPSWRLLLIAAVSCWRWPAVTPARTWWSVAAIGLLVADLCIAWAGFNPSVDPKLLAYTRRPWTSCKQDTACGA